MRIALILPGFSRDANDWAIPALQSLARQLARQHDVHVFSLRYPEAGRYQFGGLTHHAMGGGVRFGLGSLAVVARTIRAVVAQHRRAPFDLLHAFWVDEPAFTAALAGALLRRPVLASVGGGELVYFPDIGYGTQGSRWRRLLIRYALGQATVVTAGSEYGRRLCMAHGVSADKVRLAPLGVDTEHFRPGAVADMRRPVMIQAASLTPVKQQRLLLEVVSQVCQVIPEVRLLLAGSGRQEPGLRADARQLDLADHVIWLGTVPYPDMPAVYRRSHLYLQSSRHESQGMAVLEAMACGLPALGTPVGIVAEVACRPASNDARTLATQVIDLLADEAAYRHQRRLARQQVETRFSLPVTVERFRQLYLEVSEHLP